MNRISRLLFIALLVLSQYETGQAQVLPPVFECVVNDSVFWQATPNPCGPFQAYEVYASQNPTGPFSLLATVPDPNQTFFFHADANDLVWYYYLTSVHDCPGEAQLSSDTLDNQLPLAEPLTLVTVLNSAVEVTWAESPSPQTIGYIISRNTMMGTVVLDTVFGTTNYTDSNANIDNQFETYFVTALDACGNVSLIPPPHQTIFTTLQDGTACDPGITLNWSPYQNWNPGIDRYEIWVSVNGAAAVSVGEVGPTATSFVYQEANDGENLCFFIEAVQAGTDLRSRSNVICTDVMITQPLRRIELLGASVQPDGSIALEWWWDATATISMVTLQRFRFGDDVIVVENLLPGGALQEQNTELDSNVDAQQNGYEYRIAAVDDCLNDILSNPSVTPRLQGALVANGNQLSWPAYEHDLLVDFRYRLLREDGITTTEVYSGSDVSYLDDDVTQFDDGVCYTLVVNATFELFDGTLLEREVFSNIVCLTPPPRVYVPNVFAPAGVNAIFRPQLSTNNVAEYELNVYDRWGGHVFQSNELSNGWRGDKQGDAMPEGVYVYFIRLVTTNGQEVFIEGDIMLLR